MARKKAPRTLDELIESNKPKFKLDLDQILQVWGRPELYTPEACLAVIKAASEGKHKNGWALAAGAKSRTTLYDWEAKHPEFKEAMQYAALISSIYYDDLASEGIKGEIKNFNAQVWTTVVRNKMPEEYSQGDGTSSGTTNNTSITFNNLNLTESEKIAKIKTLLQTLKIANHELGTAGDTFEAEPLDE